jgi:hypothetical protein
MRGDATGSAAPRGVRDEAVETSGGSSSQSGSSRASVARRVFPFRRAVSGVRSLRLLEKQRTADFFLRGVLLGGSAGRAPETDAGRGPCCAGARTAANARRRPGFRRPNAPAAADARAPSGCSGSWRRAGRSRGGLPKYVGTRVGPRRRGSREGSTGARAGHRPSARRRRGLRLQAHREGRQAR